MADRIQLRRDTAANWTNYNPILLEGEPGIELDTDQWKLGDGIHNWSQLSYRGAECVQQTGQSTTVAMSQKATTDELDKRLNIDDGPTYYPQTDATRIDYEKGLRELYIDTDLFPITAIYAHCYSTSLYIYYKTEEITSTTLLGVIGLNYVNNNTLIDLVVDNVVVGYIVFRDKQKFLAHSQGSTVEVNLGLVTNKALHQARTFCALPANSVGSSQLINNSVIKGKVAEKAIINTNLDFRYYTNTDAVSNAYEEGIQDLFIDKTLLPITAFSVKNFNGYIYFNYKTEEVTTWEILWRTPYIVSMENYKVYEIFNDQYNPTTVVGYIVLRDKQKFLDNVPSGSDIFPMNISLITDVRFHNSFNRNENFRYYKDYTTVTNDYEEGIQDLFVDKTLLPITDFSVKNYNGSIFCAYKTNNGWTLTYGSITISLINNYQVYDIYLNEDIKIGYIVFKNKQKFADHAIGGGDNPSMNVDLITSKRLYSAWSYQQIKNNTANKYLEIHLPSVINAVVGTEINLWNDAISYSIDKGLQSPINYYIVWSNSNVGKITERGYRFTPLEQHAGHSYNITCSLFNLQNDLVEQKIITIKVLSKNILDSQKNIVFFGDSTGGTTAVDLYNDFHDSDKFTGTIPMMLGSRNAGNVRYDAFGGASWLDYSGPGRAGFRCFVTNAPTIPLNAKYTNNGYTWEVVEVNVTNGVGNILITRNATDYTVHPEASGTLVAVTSGVSNIAYNSYENSPSNPLWDSTLNDGQGGLSIEHYKQVLQVGNTFKFDAVSFLLGLNASWMSDQQITNSITALYNLFVDDNPNCLFLLGLTTCGGNTEDGWGESYGVSSSKSTRDLCYRLRKLYLSLQSTMPNIRIVPAAAEIDRYYGYGFSPRQISQRYTETEQIHNNAVHPAESGYLQLGDCFFAAFVGALTE